MAARWGFRDLRTGRVWWFASDFEALDRVANPLLNDDVTAIRYAAHPCVVVSLEVP